MLTPEKPRLPGLPAPERPAPTAAPLARSLMEAAAVLRGPVHKAQLKAYITPLMYLKRLSDMGGGGPVVLPDGPQWERLAAEEADPAGAIAGAMARLEAANPEVLGGLFSGFQETDWRAVPAERLRTLIGRMSRVRLDDDCPADVLGDAYELMLGRFADLAPKDAGEFYTPQELVGLMLRLLDPKPGESIYDPACGTGGMLLGALRRGGRECGPLRGQEINRTTAAIARANLLLHGSRDHAIATGDSLGAPAFAGEGGLATFDCVLANPPYSLKAWGPEAFQAHGRAVWGLPPAGNGDYAWIQHMVKSMAPGTGRMAALMSQGVLFRGGREGSIREAMVESGKLRLVAVLARNLFYSTTLAPCLLVLAEGPRKEAVRFVDASGIFTPRKVRNLLTEDQADRIARLCLGDDDEPELARTVAVSEIRRKGYNLAVNAYIEARLPEPEPPESVKARYLDALRRVRAAENRMFELARSVGFLDDSDVAAFIPRKEG